MRNLQKYRVFFPRGAMKIQICIYKGVRQTRVFTYNNQLNFGTHLHI